MQKTAQVIARADGIGAGPNWSYVSGVGSTTAWMSGGVGYRVLHGGDGATVVPAVRAGAEYSLSRLVAGAAYEIAARIGSPEAVALADAVVRHTAVCESIPHAWSIAPSGVWRQTIATVSERARGVVDASTFSAHGHAIRAAGGNDGKALREWSWRGSSPLRIDVREMLHAEYTFAVRSECGAIVRAAIAQQE